MIALDAPKNLVKVTASTGYSVTDSQLTLNSGDGAKLPIPPFNATWWNATDYGDPTDDPNVEIVRVVSVSGDSVAILRAQENTVASTKNTALKSYKLIAGLTALTMSSIGNALLDHDSQLDEMKADLVVLMRYMTQQGFELPEELFKYID